MMSIGNVLRETESMNLCFLSIKHRCVCKFQRELSLNVNEKSHHQLKVFKVNLDALDMKF